MNLKSSLVKFVKSEILAPRRLLFNLLWYGSHLGVFAYGWISQVRENGCSTAQIMKRLTRSSYRQGINVSPDSTR